MGWDFNPTTVLNIGGVLLRKAENIINKKYYKNGSFPTCPHSGKNLKIENYDQRKTFLLHKTQ